MTDTFISRVLGKASTAFVCVFSISLAVESLAQGQDTTPWSRDLQVIEVMLPGFYSNANQAYFDGRQKVANPQSRHNLLIEAADNGFHATLSAPDGSVISDQRWSLAEDRPKTGRAHGHYQCRTGKPLCPVWWTRDAAQFSATSDPECVNQARVLQHSELAPGATDFGGHPRGRRR